MLLLLYAQSAQHLADFFDIILYQLPAGSIFFNDRIPDLIKRFLIDRIHKCGGKKLVLPEEFPAIAARKKLLQEGGFQRAEQTG